MFPVSLTQLPLHSLTVSMCPLNQVPGASQPRPAASLFFLLDTHLYGQAQGCSASVTKMELKPTEVSGKQVGYMEVINFWLLVHLAPSGGGTDSSHRSFLRINKKLVMHLAEIK